MSYDTLGRKTAETEQAAANGAPGATTNYEYDLVGNITATVLPAVQITLGSTTYTRRPRYEYLYNQYGELETQRDAMDDSIVGALPGSLNRETTFTYDFRGRRTEILRPGDVAGQGSRTTYDRFNRPVTMTDYKGQVTYLIYDDTPPAVTDPNKLIGRLKSKLYFPSNTAYQNYLANPTEPTNLPALRVDYTYDTKGRTDSITEYERQIMGPNPALVQSHRTAYTYDREDRVVTVDNNPEGIIHYEYEEATGRQIRAYSDNNDTLYSYDERGTVDHVYVAKLNGTQYATYTGWNATTQKPEFTGTPLITTYRFTAAGELDQVILPNNVVTDYDYDALHRVELETIKRGTTQVSRYDYDSNAQGQRTAALENEYDAAGSLNQTRKFYWAYDADGRLSQEKLDVGNNGAGTGDYTSDYSIDLVGNRLKKTLDQGSNGSTDETITYSYNAKDQLSTESSNVNGTTQNIFDLNGSLTRTTRTVSATTVADAIYRYDLRNRLVGVNSDAIGTEEAVYSYDDAGNRVSRTQGAQQLNVLVNQDNPTGFSQVLEEKLSNGALVRSYVIGSDVLAQDVTVTGADAQYLSYDSHGSTRRITDATGTPLTNQIYSYDAFGQAIGFDPASAGTNLLYAGEQFDSISGQYYLRARFYNPASGRFTSADAYEGSLNNPLSMNDYLYGDGDPVDNADPTGNMSLIELLKVLHEYYKMFRREWNYKIKPLVVAGAKIGLTLLIFENWRSAWTEAQARWAKDRWTVIAVGASSPYQFVQIGKLLAIPQKKFNVKDKIDMLLGLASQQTWKQVRDRLGPKFVQFLLPMTPMGFPILNDYLLGRDQAALLMGLKPQSTEIPTVFIFLTGSHSKDVQEANLTRTGIAALTGKLVQAREPKGYTWHHHEVMGVMMLVNQQIHRAIRLFEKARFGHIGGKQFWLATQNDSGSYKP
jgi:RHS repeat-associated protein